MPETVYTLTTKVFSETINSTKVVSLNIDDDTFIITFDYPLLTTEREKTFHATEPVMTKLLSKNTVIGKVKISWLHDINMIILPHMYELQDIKITIEYPEIRPYDMLLSGYLDLQNRFDEPTARGTVTGQESVVTSQSSPEIKYSIVSTDFRYSKTHPVPLTWGREVKFFPEDRIQSIFTDNQYFIMENTNPSRSYFNIDNVITVIANYRAFVEENNLNPNDMPQEGMIRYYPFDGNLNDNTDNAQHGSWHGTQQYTDGIVDKGIHIVDDGSGVNIPDVNNNEITVSLYYYFESTGGGGWNTILCRNGETYQHVLINDSSREIGFYNNGWRSSGYALETGKWYNIVMYKKDAREKIYINNELILDRNDSFSNVSYPLHIIGNAGGWSQGARGIIDEVRIYNRELTEEERERLYALMRENMYTLNNEELYDLRAIFKNQAILEHCDNDTLRSLLSVSSTRDQLLYTPKRILSHYATLKINPFDLINSKYIIIFDAGAFGIKYKCIYW